PRLTLLLLSLLIAAGPARADAADLQTLIDRAIEQGDAELVIPPGEYRLTPPAERAPHLTIHGAENLRIVATGVTLVCTKLNLAVDVEDCRNLTLEGLTIDYDPLPFTQGTIAGVSEDKRVLEIQLDRGYPPLGKR